MAKWVIRRKADGLFWAGYARGKAVWGPLASAGPWTEGEHTGCFESAIEDGEEWVELDDAGQPVEAKPVAAPVRAWAMRTPSGLYHMGCGDWTEHLARAMTYTTKWPPHNPTNTMVRVLVHPDGTVTLDERVPAVAPPVEDEPIPYRLTDTDERDNLIARIAVQYERAARHVRKAARLEKRLAKVAP